MPKTASTCPRCRQPVVVDVEQLFDNSADPQAKQRLLSGNFNVIRCPNCGYEGAMATPLVYHDGEKELLLTYFPPDLGLPVNEQERLVGPYITQVTNKLPPEKRKAYLLRPQTMLTMQTLIERVLEADGITKEMLDEQQKKLNLLQRLLSTQPANRPDIIQQEAALIDGAFFNIMNRLIEATLSQGDQNSARQLALLQQDLLKNTEFGRELQKQAEESEEAVRSLQQASQSGTLTRDTLLDMIVGAATSPAKLNTLVSYARSGMDYEFFQLLTNRIENAQNDDERKHLSDLRDRLLKMTQEIDRMMKEQMEDMRNFLEELIKQPDIEKATEANLQAMNELFMEVLQNELQQARQKGDFERSGKLQRVAGVIEKASAPPPELAIVEELISAEDEEGRRKVLEAHAEMVTPEFLELLTTLTNQAGEQNPEVAEQIQAAYKSALRYSMQKNLNQ